MAGAFLQGYRDQESADRQGALSNMQQLTGVLSLKQHIDQQAMVQQKAEEQRQFRGALAALTPEQLADPKAVTSIAMKYGDPNTLLKELLPKPAESYTLASDAVRFGPNNVEVARGAPKKVTPMVEHNFPVANDKIQPHISLDQGVTWNPIPGSVPSSKFAKQVAGQTTIHNPAPVTPVTIADPKDPSKTIIVDGRTMRKIGDGPKLSQTGSIDLGLQQKMPQAKRAVSLVTQNMDRLDTALAELDKDPGLSNITGSIAGRTPNITNTATGAQAKLKSIKSQIFQSSLQAMREASKTGGAVGNVSDKEGDKLENTIAALDQAQSTKDFKAQIAKAREQVKLSKQIINQAYQDQFGNVQPYSPGQGGSSGTWKDL